MTPDIREKAERLIEAMCLTWRHDFGFVVPEDNGTLAIRTTLSSGMTECEREALRRDMRQLYEHHIGPALLEAHKAGREEAAKWLEDEAEFRHDAGSSEGQATWSLLRDLASAIRSLP